jgi:hypothetical protein
MWHAGKPAARPVAVPNLGRNRQKGGTGQDSFPGVIFMFVMNNMIFFSRVVGETGGLWDGALPKVWNQ